MVASNDPLDLHSTHPNDKREVVVLDKVVLISTGGTISSVMDDNGRYSAHFGVQDLVTNIKLTHPFTLETIEFCKILSFGMTPDLVFNLTKEIARQLTRPDVRGVVVTHGTATIEESAYLLSILLKSEKPVVFTGSMLPFSERDSDAIRNITNSILVCLSPEAQGMGVMICLGSEIHSARDGVKFHRSSLVPFRSPGWGLLGVVDLEKVIFARRPLRQTFIPADRIEQNVDLIKVVSGMDGRFIRSSMEAGAKGIVIEGLPGRGSITPGMLDDLKNCLAKGAVVVLSSRSSQGRVAATTTSGGVGSADLASIGVILGGDLSPAKLRLLLMVALANLKGIDNLKELIQAS